MQSKLDAAEVELCNLNLHTQTYLEVYIQEKIEVLSVRFKEKLTERGFFG